MESLNLNLEKIVISCEVDEELFLDKHIKANTLTIDNNPSVDIFKDKSENENILCVSNNKLSSSNKEVLQSQINSFQKLMELKLSNIQNILEENTQITGNKKSIKSTSSKELLQVLLQELKTKLMNYFGIIFEITKEYKIGYNKMIEKNTACANCNCKEMKEAINLKDTELTSYNEIIEKLKLEHIQLIENSKCQSKQIEELISDKNNYQDEIKALQCKIKSYEATLDQYKTAETKHKAINTKIESEKQSLIRQVSELDKQLKSNLHNYKSEQKLMQDQCANFKKEKVIVESNFSIATNLLKIMSDDVSEIMSAFSLKVDECESKKQTCENDTIKLVDILCRSIQMLNPIIRKHLKCSRDTFDALCTQERSASLLKIENDQLSKQLAEALPQLDDCQLALDMSRGRIELLGGQLQLAEQRCEALQQDNQNKTQLITQLEMRAYQIELSLQLSEERLRTNLKELEMVKQVNDTFLDSSCQPNSDKQLVSRLLSENIQLKSKINSD